jgi:hypothetical protein
MQALDVQHVSLCVAIDIMRDQVEIPQLEESFALTSKMVLIAGCVHELEADAFQLGVNHALVFTRSHYEDSIKLDQVCL